MGEREQLRSQKLGLKASPSSSENGSGKDEKIIMKKMSLYLELRKELEKEERNLRGKMRVNMKNAKKITLPRLVSSLEKWKENRKQ